jgi:hypothetical protein
MPSRRYGQYPTTRHSRERGNLIFGDWREEIPAFAGMTGWGGNDGGAGMMGGRE